MTTDDTTTTPRRDTDSWARHSGPLSVGDAPEGALNLNVDGRQLAGPVQGFGKLWQKTYRVALPGTEHGAADGVLSSPIARGVAGSRSR